VRYQRLARLASGGTADIYVGILSGAAGYEKPVVLKRARGSKGTGLGNDGLLREGLIGAALNHPNVIHVYELTELDGELHLVMELIEGISLEALQSELALTGGSIPWPVAARIARDAALGLDHAHRATDPKGYPLEVIHRDVSPKNLVVQRSGVTKVVDFGIARSTLSELTREPVVKGTASYLSPEQAVGDPLGPSTDVFSLGIVLHEMVSGLPLFQRDDLRQTMTAIVARIIGGRTSLIADSTARIGGSLRILK